MAYKTFPRSISIFAFFLRSYWLFLGPNIVLIFGFLVWVNHWSALFIADTGYCVLAIAPLIARGLDMRYFDEPQFPDDPPASLAQWGRYAVKSLFAYTVIWIVAQVLSFFCPG